MPVQNVLWGRAAGRCQFRGCNQPLWRSRVTKEPRNLAQKAHIYAFSMSGPRASTEWPRELIHNVENLILVCDGCHKTIDADSGPVDYPAVRLQAMKRAHELRIELATSVDEERQSHVVVYCAPIGSAVPLPTDTEARIALSPARYPVEERGIVLGTWANATRDRDEAFWHEQRRDLAAQFVLQIQTRLERDPVRHLSVFAMAPQPLLVQLGVHLTDIAHVDVYQRHREPPGWAWPRNQVGQPFVFTEPSIARGKPALVLSVSTRIAQERVARALNGEIAIWELTVPTPHHDAVCTSAMLADFRATLRLSLERIKELHGHRTPLHVFPALPVSLAVELGRVRQPKAHPDWVLYDEQQSRGGFVPAFILSNATGGSQHEDGR